MKNKFKFVRKFSRGENVYIMHNRSVRRARCSVVATVAVVATRTCVIHRSLRSKTSGANECLNTVR